MHTFFSFSKEDLSFEWERNFGFDSEQPMGPSTSAEDGQQLNLASCFGGESYVYVLFMEFSDKDLFSDGPDTMTRLDQDFTSLVAVGVSMFCRAISVSPTDPNEFLILYYAEGLSSPFYISQLTYDGLSTTQVALQQFIPAGTNFFADATFGNEFALFYEHSFEGLLVVGFYRVPTDSADRGFVFDFYDSDGVQWTESSIDTSSIGFSTVDPGYTAKAHLRDTLDLFYFSILGDHEIL